MKPCKRRRGNWGSALRKSVEIMPISMSDNAFLQIRIQIVFLIVLCAVKDKLMNCVLLHLESLKLLGGLSSPCPSNIPH